MGEKVQLGKSDLFVVPVGLGANAVGGHNLYHNIDEEVSKNIVRTAIQSGMNFIDTASSYGMGRSEELIGEVLKEMNNRSEVIIATKGGRQRAGDKTIPNNHPDFLKEDVDRSLKRLKTDYIDLYYIHYPDEDTPKEEAIGALKELKDEGKIRAIGVSNFTLHQLKEANTDGYVDVYQGGYNLLERDAETTYFPYCREKQISFIPYYPLAAGLLAGKYTRDMKFNDLRARLPYFQAGVYEENLEKAAYLQKLADEKQVEPAHIVLAWYLTRDAVSALIPGAKKPEQVISNLQTLNVQLTEEEIQEIGRIFK